MKRRDFLKRLAKSFFVLLISCLGLAALYLYPARIRKKAVQFFPVIDEDDIPRAGVKRVDFSYEVGSRKIHAKAYIIASGGAPFALSPVCSHLGCLVNWDHNKREFLCPCHGGKYGMTGEVTAGPPPAPLTRLPLEIRDGKVYVGIKI